MGGTGQQNSWWLVVGVLLKSKLNKTLSFIPAAINVSVSILLTGYTFFITPFIVNKLHLIYNWNNLHVSYVLTLLKKITNDSK